MLIANDLTETIDFYTEPSSASSASAAGTTARADWCQVERDGVRLMFNQGDPEPHDHGDGVMHADVPALAGSIYINVDDVDALFAEFQAEGRVVRVRAETSSLRHARVRAPRLQRLPR